MFKPVRYLGRVTSAFVRLAVLAAFVAAISMSQSAPVQAQQPVGTELLRWTETPTASGIRELFSGNPEQQFAAGSSDLAQPVFALEDRQVSQVSIVGNEVRRSVVAEIPVGEIAPRLAVWNGDLFLFGTNAYRLGADARWIPLGEAPGEVTGSAAVAVTTNHIYLVSSGHAFRFDPRDRSWAPVSAPEAIDPKASAIALGAAHLAVFGEVGGQEETLLYHIVTDRWFPGDAIDLPEGPRLALAGDGRFEIVSESQTVQGEAVLPDNGLSVLDYAVVIALFGILLGIGFWASGQAKRSSGEFFRGGGKIPWWAAALSLFATGSSAITIMSMPAMAFNGNWIYFSIGLFLIATMVPLFAFVYVPILRSLNLASANEYLERRFGLSVRLMGFASFSLYQILGRVAAILLLPAIAINAIMGIPIVYCILLMGLVTTLVVAIGGFAAVIWTDVVLAILMVLAVGLSLLFALSALEIDAPQAWALLESQNKLQLFDWRLDWGAPVVTVLFMNALATALGYAGDQNFLQRVQCTPTKSGAVSASIGQLFVAVPLNFVLFCFGTILFLFYYTRPELLSAAIKPEGIYPYYAATTLPPGLGGLVAVALLAATISTVSSALNSVSNLGVEDIYRRFWPRVSDESCVRLGRWLTVGLGVFGTALALLLASMSSLQSIWDLFLMVMGLIVGPVTGIFVLGIFTRSANTAGIWIGAVGSLIANALATTFLDLHSTAFLPIGVFSCLFIGYVASLALGGAGDRDLTGLTVFSRKGALRKEQAAS